MHGGFCQGGDLPTADSKLSVLSDLLVVSTARCAPAREQIFIAVLVFSDTLTVLKVSGLGLAMFGSIAYKIARAKPNIRGNDGEISGDDR